ncbi:MAG: hypothetical protein NTY99_01560 [DPANN group archaeon]|nr:hypothetical protein [DPANN group archaeon]
MKESEIKEYDTWDPATNTVGPTWLDKNKEKGKLEKETGLIVLGTSQHYNPNQTKLDDFAKYAEKFPVLNSAKTVEADVTVRIPGLDDIVFPYVALVDGGVTAIISDADVPLVTKIGKTYARQVRKPVNFYSMSKGFVGSAFPR